MADIRFPDFTGARGIGYWLRFKNILASRQKMLRVDYSNEWRYSFGDPNPVDRSVPLSRLTNPGKNLKDGFRIIILGDTGEGDRSQYGLVPLINALKPDFIIINGDVAYPAGRIGMDESKDDFIAGFYKPYSNLNCSIWATPGNHEYYSPNNGRDFYDVFCTRKYDRLWTEYGLRHNVLQPGMYWELSDSVGESNLIIIGLDSGKSANLDGHNDWWQFWKRKIYPDHTQHIWLDDRLRKAQNQGSKVIILFHIPALTREKQVEEYLSTLHSLIADYNCVELVICGHDHNHQQYNPDTFRRYIENQEAHRPINNKVPEYIVNGGGGAFLQSTDYADRSYKGVRYPTRQQWKKYARFGRRVVAMGRDKSFISRVVGMFSKAALSDADAAKLLSFIFVEYRPKWPDDFNMETRITPVFLDDINLLYDQDEIVNVLDKNHPIKNSRVEACFQRNLEIRFKN
jgi:3',5'-cyclic AMP phosphodiesterase CpdA